MKNTIPMKENMPSIIDGIAKEDIAIAFSIIPKMPRKSRTLFIVPA